ncbi:NAD-dependent epimerase/dehydratase family protein [Gordonia sp. HNM0687]|uniref:NAD-dependent epimerase/dehydratase family protein n=1 Tax=Gordonia mangrovi TaxID=2665643 RepID=A0A6L7GQ37_9ACTN|nr:NAD-dependent epimerase/dehydratase family protein [Gordonia mangrovi]MXP21703.1 NAD-dependent epimerase/dehydratase family protein [Gordonia mangrovi]UVF80435.1 NAD-dependent epimerase/dehydratase family protein [Gordonia mangrovi]
MTTDTILVTGGSGFIAGHCILQLLEQGYSVRTTVRDMRKETQVRNVLDAAGMSRGDALTFVQADLMHDVGWSAAVNGIDAVLHVASPVQPGKVKDENDVIAPAREGTLRVLRAARDAGVRRVVLTSAFHAVGFGHGRSHAPFTEEDWSVLDGPGVDAYGKSKILAERAAWDFTRAEGGTTELVTLQPVAVMGPLMGKDISGSNHLIQNMLTGKMAGLPDMYIPIVDVRDVAAAHVGAIKPPDAAGQRFLIAAAEPAVALSQVSKILRDSLGDSASRVPARRIPGLVVRVMALSSEEARGAAAELGFQKIITIDKARKVLGFSPRSSAEAIVAAAESIVANGLG